MLGLLLVVAGNTIRQVVTSEPSVPEIVRQQVDEIEDLKLKNQILTETNSELLGNSVKLPAETTWGQLYIGRRANDEN